MRKGLLISSISNDLSANLWQLLFSFLTRASLKEKDITTKSSIFVVSSGQSIRKSNFMLAARQRLRRDMADSPVSVSVWSNGLQWCDTSKFLRLSRVNFDQKNLHLYNAGALVMAPINYWRLTLPMILTDSFFRRIFWTKFIEWLKSRAQGQAHSPKRGPCLCVCVSARECAWFSNRLISNIAPFELGDQSETGFTLDIERGERASHT